MIADNNDMNTEAAAFFLQQTKLFQNLPPRVLQDLVARAYTKQICPDQFFIHQGEPAVAVYLLLEGHAKVLQVTPDGHQLLTHFVGAGQEFGLIAVLSGYTYPVSVQAIDRSSALVWHGEVLAQYAERYPALAFNALHIFVAQNQALQRRYQELLTEKVEQRVAQALIRLTNQVGRPVGNGILIDLPLSREDLAEMVGTTLYSVSRILSGWEDQGWVESGRERVVVCSVEALQVIA